MLILWKTFRLSRLALILAMGTVLSGCATSGSQTSSGAPVENVLSSLKAGDIRLPCQMSCSMAWGWNAIEINDLYTKGSWSELASEVTRVGLSGDLQYFYLGRAAEGLGYITSARIYYKLSMEDPYKCDDIFDNCDGVAIPDETLSRLEKTQNKPDVVLVDSSTSTATKVNSTNPIEHELSTVFTIEGKVQAQFPEQPRFKNEAELLEQPFKRYASFDVDNFLLYTLQSQVNKVVINEAEIDNALTKYVHSYAESLDGIVRRENSSGHNGGNGSYFTIRYNQQGITKRINGAVIYRDGYIYEWSVLDLPSRSKSDGSNIFNNSIQFFSIK